jgi:hypothetical protein
VERDESQSEGHPDDGTAKGASGRDSSAAYYWYNQVTRRVRWTEPVLPEVLPLDDEGSVLFTDSNDDRAMPSRASILAAGRYDLHAAVVAAGGYTSVADDLDRWPAWPPTRVSWSFAWKKRFVLACEKGVVLQRLAFFFFAASLEREDICSRA